MTAKRQAGKDGFFFMAGLCFSAQITLKGF
jgi:hypothetical protein